MERLENGCYQLTQALQPTPRTPMHIPTDPWLKAKYVLVYSELEGMESSLEKRKREVAIAKITQVAIDRVIYNDG